MAPFKGLVGMPITPSGLFLAQPHRITVALRAEASVILFQPKRTSTAVYQIVAAIVALPRSREGRRLRKIVRIFLSEQSRNVRIFLDQPTVWARQCDAFEHELATDSRTYEGRCNGKTVVPIWCGHIHGAGDDALAGERGVRATLPAHH